MAARKLLIAAALLIPLCIPTHASAECNYDSADQYNGWGCNLFTGGGGIWTKNLVAGEPDCEDVKVWNNEFSGLTTGVMLAIHTADGITNFRRTRRPWFHKNYVHDVTNNGGLELFNSGGRRVWVPSCGRLEP